MCRRANSQAPKHRPNLTPGGRASRIRGRRCGLVAFRAAGQSLTGTSDVMLREASSSPSNHLQLHTSHLPLLRRPTNTLTMASIAGRSAFRASLALRAPFQASRPRWASATADAKEREHGSSALRKGARRDPELYVCIRKRSN